jgi:pimeloyl-ACP methyl ester carboxylesterase
MPTFMHAGAELHYQDVGSGEPVLFLHGLGSRGKDWAPQLAEFSRTHRCLTLDARGSGSSRDLEHPRGPFSLKQFAADAAALLRHLGAAPAHVVGLSMGGMTALQLAVDSPEVLRTMTVVNANPEVIPRTFAEHRMVLLRRFIARFLGPAPMAKVLAPKLFPKPEHAALRAQFIAQLGEVDRHAYRASTLAVLGWTVMDRIGGVQTPTLVLAADNDYTSVASKEAYVRRMPDARLVVVPDSHHALPLECPAEFNAALRSFLDGHSRQAA